MALFLILLAVVEAIALAFLARKVWEQKMVIRALEQRRIGVIRSITTGNAGLSMGFIVTDRDVEGQMQVGELADMSVVLPPEQ